MLDYLACIQIISIHALREEGDKRAKFAHIANAIFLSTPSARGRPNGLVAFATGYTFLSTPSARRATAGPLKTWTPS